MLGAMEPADREAVEAILTRLGQAEEQNGSPLPARSLERRQPQSPAPADVPAAPTQQLVEDREAPSPPPSKATPTPAAQPPSPPPAAPREPPAEETVDFLFSDTPPSSNVPATPAPTPTGLEDLFTSAPSAASSHPDSMFGNIFGDDAQSDVSGVATRVTVAAESHESDTAERAELRRNRAKRVQDRIDQQLREKLERDRAEEEQRDEQVGACTITVSCMVAGATCLGTATA